MRNFHPSDNPYSFRRRSPLRPVFLALVIAGVCWGFWNNSENRLESLINQGLLADQTKALSPAHKEEILNLLKTFKKDVGIPLEINILKTPPGINDHNASRIYLDIVPAQGRAYLFLPPLVRRAVGEEFRLNMEEALRRDFTSGDWRQGLIPAIQALRAKIGQVTR